MICGHILSYMSTLKLTCAFSLSNAGSELSQSDLANVDRKAVETDLDD